MKLRPLLALQDDDEGPPSGASLAALGPRDSPLGSERWAIVTLALTNGLALERLIDPAGVPSDLMAAVQAHIAHR